MGRVQHVCIMKMIWSDVLLAVLHFLFAFSVCLRVVACINGSLTGIKMVSSCMYVHLFWPRRAQCLNPSCVAYIK